MAAERADRESYYAATIQHLAAAVGYLARLGAPHPVPALQAGPVALPELPRPLSRRHGRRLRIREEGDEDDDDDEDVIVDVDLDNPVVNPLPVVLVDNDVDVDVDDFTFGVQDLYYAVVPILAAAPPYPLSRGLSDAFLQSSGWAVLLFANGVIFTFAVTFYSIVVFRSTRRCLPRVPTILRALLLAVTLGAEAAAAVHLPPSSRLATFLSYVSMILHVAVYLLAWAGFCFWMSRRRRLHPLP